MRFDVQPRPARFVRLSQLATDDMPWTIAEIGVHGR
jgi:hypothetical protein